MVPPPLVPPLCTLSAGPGPSRFVCYCEGEGGGDAAGFNLQVTDAAELWSTCFTPAGLAALKARFGLSAAEDITHRFRCRVQRLPPGCRHSRCAWQTVCAGWSSGWQTQIPREATPGLASGDGVPGSRSSTPASRVRSLLVAWTSRTPEAEQKARPTRNEPVRGGAAPGDPPPPVHPAPQARSQQINAPMGLDQALLWGKEVWDAPLGPGIWAGATGC
ncbi:protein PAXX isoform X5 [Choloepus didactylus]|uniref:protein PAXX isoform X5 n=1 Tax=Choloepus didactylus TaxID=27675 RepID=UPI0018A0595E|nr:protein PAXX isoform X5 [Choloepus didactylus]